MIDTAAPADRAIVIFPHPPGADGVETRLDEASGLAEALDLSVTDAFAAPLRKLEPSHLFGAGKVDEIASRIASAGVTVAVLDAALTPVQQRNLEKAWNAKVVDRTGLILEIFGRRARTREGRLQVELARLGYERSRLVHTWTHLERQRGGRGFLAGPGETQIETDRRLIAERMAKLRRELEDVRRTRGLHRKQRREVPFPLVALVGYTNAGKSTLFNKMTGARVLAKDMLFATLDTTVRAFETPGGMRALMSDTVGFITDLPTELIAAFRATLEEVREADLLVHVLDVSAPDHAQRREEVEAILDSIGAGREHGQPVIEALNKIDLLDDEAQEDAARPPSPRAGQGAPNLRIPVSAVTGEGMPALVGAIERALEAGSALLTVKAAPTQGRAVAWLHEHGAVLSEKTDRRSGKVTVRARLRAEDAGRFAAAFPDVETLQAPQG